MIGIKHTKTWNKSFKRLKNILQEKGYYTEESPRILLNFGSNFHPDNNRLTVLNQNIGIMLNKEKMNRRLDELDIRHPKTYYYPFLDLPVSNDECVVKGIHSQMGKNIKFTTFRQIIGILDEDKIVQDYIPFEREFRVVVDFLGVIGQKEKRLYKNSKIKNSKSCNFFRVRKLSLERFCIKVCRELRIDFTGIDIGYLNGYYYVIELNSAPSIYDKYATILADHMIGILHR